MTTDNFLRRRGMNKFTRFAVETAVYVPVAIAMYGITYFSVVAVVAEIFSISIHVIRTEWLLRVNADMPWQILPVVALIALSGLVSHKCGRRCGRWVANQLCAEAGNV